MLGREMVLWCWITLVENGLEEHLETLEAMIASSAVYPGSFFKIHFLLVSNLIRCTSVLQVATLSKHCYRVQINRIGLKTL